MGDNYFQWAPNCNQLSKLPFHLRGFLGPGDHSFALSGPFPEQEIVLKTVIQPNPRITVILSDIFYLDLYLLFSIIFSQQCNITSYFPSSFRNAKLFLYHFVICKRFCFPGVLHVTVKTTFD